MDLDPELGLEPAPSPFWSWLHVRVGAGTRNGAGTSMEPAHFKKEPERDPYPTKVQNPAPVPDPGVNP